MFADPVGSYVRWLHTGWPAGTVERLPEVNEDGTTARARRAHRRRPDRRAAAQVLRRHRRARGAGDRARRGLRSERKGAGRHRRRGHHRRRRQRHRGGDGGARRRGLRYVVFEAARSSAPSSTFPKAKPIFTYPTEMTPAGRDAAHRRRQGGAARRARGAAARQAASRCAKRARRAHRARAAASSSVHVAGSEPVRALRVIIAIGRSGNYRALGVPGEKLDKVYHRLYDPKDYAGQAGAGRRRRRLARWRRRSRSRMAGARRDAQPPRHGIRAPQAGERRAGCARSRRTRAPTSPSRSRLRAGEHGDGRNMLHGPSRRHAARAARLEGRRSARRRRRGHRRATASSRRCPTTWCSR